MGVPSIPADSVWGFCPLERRKSSLPITSRYPFPPRSCKFAALSLPMSLVLCAYPSRLLSFRRRRFQPRRTLPAVFCGEVGLLISATFMHSTPTTPLPWCLVPPVHQGRFIAASATLSNGLSILTLNIKPHERILHHPFQLEG